MAEASWAQAEWNDRVFVFFILFLHKVSFRILLFENIWPVTIHGSCSEKYTGVLLSCITFFISLALGKHQKGVLLCMQVWSPAVEYKLYLLLDEQERKGKRAVEYLFPGLSLINTEVNFGKITTSIYLFFSSGKHITFPSHPQNFILWHFIKQNVKQTEEARSISS